MEIIIATFSQCASTFENKIKHPSSYHKATTEFSHARRPTTPAIKDSENGRCLLLLLECCTIFFCSKGLAIKDYTSVNVPPL